MSNKTNIKDVEVLENIVNDYKFKHSSKKIMDKSTYLGLAQTKAIENILAYIERLEKEKEIHIKLEQQYKKEYLDKKAKYDSLVEKIRNKDKEVEYRLNETIITERDTYYNIGKKDVLQQLLDTEKE